MKVYNFVLFVFSSVLLVNCVYKNQRDFIKPSNGNSTDLKSGELITDKQISFSSQISPIFQSRCNSCHSPKSTDSNSPGDYFFTLDGSTVDYIGIKKKVDETHPGSAKSKIEYRILSTIPDEEMPFRQDPLNEEQIRLIRSWIAQGAKNN